MTMKQLAPFPIDLVLLTVQNTTELEPCVKIFF